jgi:hypothetical protein
MSKTVRVGKSLFYKIKRSVTAIIHIHDAPVAVETLTVFAPIARRAAIVDIGYGKSAAGPVLDLVL